MKKQFRITLNGKSYDVVAEVIGEEPEAQAQTRPGNRPARSAAASAPAPSVKQPSASATAEEGAVPSPLAGKVVSIDVTEGAAVKAGDQVVTLEAMKMNTVVSAPTDGAVGKILVSAGDSVEEGQPLLELS